jgi:hypothetical protein
MIPAFAAAVALLQAAPPGAGLPPTKTLVPYDPILAGGPPFRRLFLDAMVTEESEGLERVFHAARKNDPNPIFVKEKEWEGWGPACGGTVVRVGSKLRMYYYCLADREDGKICVAESTDGLHWTRPDVGEVEYRGSRKNNIVLCGTQVFKLNSPPSPERRWITFGFNDGRARLGYSPDGLRWKWDASAADLFSSSDVINYFLDPYGNRLCATWKVASRRHRSAGIVYSRDLLKWEKPVSGAVFAPDDLDPDATQVYGMPVFAYQGAFIGLPWIYHARWLKYGRYSSPNVMFEAQEGSPRTIDVQMAWSWNLINWTRTLKREPFIENGPVKEFDCGLAFTATSPIVMGDELWFYYTGWDQIHEDYKGIKSAVGLARLRLDGFCSMRAGDSEGWLISRREVFGTPKVTINAACRAGGYVTAEILDRNNNVIPGFEKENCVPFTGDSVRGELSWKTPAFAARIKNKDKKIRFGVRNADLYSYLPADINRKIDDGWPDH